VLDIVGPSAVRLDIEGNEHPVFHYSLLRPVAGNPFPSQKQVDWQPPPTTTEGRDSESPEPEWLIEAITDHRIRRVGRGGVREFLVRWVGYADATWESEETVESAAALDEYERRIGKRVAGEALVLPPLRKGSSRTVGR
jgi:hypothetical protein